MYCLLRKGYQLLPSQVMKLTGARANTHVCTSVCALAMANTRIIPKLISTAQEGVVTPWVS